MKRLIIFDLDDTFYEYESTHKSAKFSGPNSFDDYQEFYKNYENTKQHVEHTGG